MPITQSLLDTGTAHTSTPTTNTTAPESGRLTILWASAAAGAIFVTGNTTGTGGFNATWTIVQNTAIASSQRYAAWRAITASSSPGLISFKLSGGATDVSWIVEQYAGVWTSVGGQGVVQAAQATDTSTTATALAPALGAFTTSGNGTAYGAEQADASTEFTPASSFTRDIHLASTVPNTLVAEVCPVSSTGPYGTFNAGGTIVAIAMELATAPTPKAGRHRGLLGVGV